MTDMAEKYELNDGHIHEALDRVHVATCYLEEFIQDHPLISAVAVFRDDVKRAVAVLSGLYQGIGSCCTISEVESRLGLTDGYKAITTDNK